MAQSASPFQARDPVLKKADFKTGVLRIKVPHVKQAEKPGAKKVEIES